jgi:nucleoid DNA-binding protein
MNTTEFAREMATATGLKVSQCERLLKWQVARIAQELVAGNTVKLYNFGHLSVSDRKARDGHNPQKPGEKIQIPAMKVAKWRVGVAVKDVLNGRRKVDELYDNVDVTIVKPAAPKTEKPAAKTEAASAPAAPAEAPAAPAAPIEPAPAAPAEAPAAPAAPAEAPAPPPAADKCSRSL